MILFGAACGKEAERPDIEILREADSLEEARNSNGWEHAGRIVPNFGFKTSGVWARFPLENKNPEAWRIIIEVGSAYLDRIDLFFISDGNVMRQSAGDTVDFRTRTVPHRNPAFRLSLPPGSKSTVYLHVTSKGTIMVPVRIWEADEFLYKAMPEYLIHGLYFGTIASLLVYNFMIFVFVRERSYLYYCLYLSMILVSYLLLNGFAQQFFFQYSPFILNEGLLFVTALAIVSAALFNREFLQNKKVNSNMDKLMMSLIWFAVIVAISSLLLPFMISVRLITALMPLGSIALFLNAIMAARSGVQQSRYFILAWSALAAGSIVESATSFTLLPMSLAGRFGTQLGTVAEVLLFSLALGRRIRRLSEEKGKAQARLSALEKDMELARAIQERILPHSIPVSEAEIKVTYIPLHAVGGDFYDFHETGERSLGILIADVTGHGVSAALDSSTVKVAFRTVCSEIASPGIVLGKMNQFLRTYIQYRFVSAFCIYLDFDAMQMKFAAAGHPPVLVLRQGKVIPLESEGMLLGVIQSFDYKDATFDLQPGDKLILYTDGLYEDLPGEDYTIPLYAQVERCAATTDADAFGETLVHNLSQMRTLLSDDITVITIDIPEPAVALR